MTVKSETTGPLGSGSGGTSTPGVFPTATNRWYTSPATISSATAVAMSANVIYYQPFNLTGMPIDRIGINVTAGSAGLCRLGIYTNANGAPGTLILDAGTVDTTSIALVEATIATTYLPGTWVWLCAVFNATPTVTIGSLGTGAIIGAATFGGSRGLSATFAFAALTAAAPATSLGPLANCVMIGVRKTA